MLVVTNGQSAEGGGQMVRGRGLQEDERGHGGYLAVDRADIFRSLDIKLLHLRHSPELEAGGGGGGGV